MINNYKKGVTLLEILIVVTLLGILVSIVFTQFSSQKETQSIKNATQSTLSLIDKARTETLASLNASSYSVHFQPDKIILYQGTSAYVSGTSNAIETVNIDSPATISNVSWTNNTPVSGDFYFNRLSGLPSVTGASVTIKTSNFYQIVTISGTGFVELGSIVSRPSGTSAPVVGTSTTWSLVNTQTHIVTPGSNLLLLEISTHSWSGSSYCGSIGGSPTYNGSAMTRVLGPNWTSNNGLCQEYWYLLSPPAGSYPISMHVDTANELILAATAINISNASQTNTFGTYATNVNSWGSSVSTSVNASPTDIVLDTLTTTHESSSCVSTVNTAGQSSIWHLLNSSETDKCSYGSKLTGNASGSVTMSWTMPISTVMFLSAIPIHGATN